MEQYGKVDVKSTLYEDYGFICPVDVHKKTEPFANAVRILMKLEKNPWNRMKSVDLLPKYQVTRNRDGSWR